MKKNYKSPVFECQRIIFKDNEGKEIPVNKIRQYKDERGNFASEVELINGYSFEIYVEEIEIYAGGKED